MSLGRKTSNIGPQKKHILNYMYAKTFGCDLARGTQCQRLSSPKANARHGQKMTPETLYNIMIKQPYSTLAAAGGGKGQQHFKRSKKATYTRNPREQPPSTCNPKQLTLGLYGFTRFRCSRLLTLNVILTQSLRFFGLSERIFLRGLGFCSAWVLSWVGWQSRKSELQASWTAPSPPGASRSSSPSPTSWVRKRDLGNLGNICHQSLRCKLDRACAHQQSGSVRSHRGT